MVWRPMTPADFAAVKSVADFIHVSHPEDLDVFVERQRLYPEGCRVLVEDRAIVGYAVSHPWRIGEPPPLNTQLGSLPFPATTFYVHDVALLPQTRGKGHAALAVEGMAQHARATGLGNLSLVAVNNSGSFWEKLGFRAATVAGLDAKLLSYGPDARLMVRRLTAAGA